MSMPRHVAIIMDGNGRWAQERHLPRIAGHQQGVLAVRRVVGECIRHEIPYLTLYAFSSENWQRSESEVEALMSLLGHYLVSEIDLFHQQQIRLNVIGDLERLPPALKTLLYEKLVETAVHSRMTLTLALSYGARDEVVRAARGVGRKLLAGDVSLDQIDERLFSSFLDTEGLPDPDLLIRTSGEKRVSNFLLWQIAYTELYFCSCFWPDFDEKTLNDALIDYQQRCRRFGLTAEQCVSESDLS
ncbi:MAG: isoprenyl transferase [Desulfuromonadaceae bacterium]|nr:isoprenyl transferase [Desulfuromonadaceae bacterium]